MTETKEVYGFYLNILTETFILNLFSFSIAENANIVGTAFDRNVNIYKVLSFKDFKESYLDIEHAKK